MNISSAIKRNRGVGLKPGVWFFEEFEFMPGIIGSAKVEYECVWRRLMMHEIPFGDTSPPYDLRVNNPWVSDICFHDSRSYREKIQVLVFEKSLKNAVLEAWRDAEHWVLEFEMGLL